MVRAISLSLALTLVNANPEVVGDEGNWDVDVDDVADMEVTMLQLKTEVTTKKKVLTPPQAAHTWTSAYDDIKGYLMENGYRAADVERAAVMVAPWEEAGDRRQAALHFLTIEAENAKLGLGPKSPELSLAQTNSSTAYFAESGSISLWGGGRFLGPLWNTRCPNPFQSRGGDVGSCAQQCEEWSCQAFSVNGGTCEFYNGCSQTDETGGYMMYVRNAEGIQPHLLPRRYVGGSAASFFVTGDWGGATSPGRASMHYVRSSPTGSDQWNFDHYGQDNVARRMGEVGSERAPALVVNAGDNFYWGGINHWTRGGHGVHDHFWRTGFENMYTHPSLNVPWISIMGNHDYGGVGCFSDMKAQFDFTTKDLLRFSRWKMPSPYYSHQIDFDGFRLELFMLDTNIDDARFGARGGGVCQQHLCGGGATTADPHECVDWFENMQHAQEQWLGEALASSSARWKIIVGHHKPAGSHAEWLRPLLAQHNVQLVVGSHTHEMAFFNHYSNIGRPLLVVGAGGGAQTNPGCGGAVYCGGVYGFSEIEINHDQIGVRIHEVSGSTPMHRYICADGQEQGSPCSSSWR